MPDQPWQKIRSLGNRLRHEYDAIREDRSGTSFKPTLSRSVPPVKMRCGDCARRKGCEDRPCLRLENALKAEGCKIWQADSQSAAGCQPVANLPHERGSHAFPESV
jgi:hypothetical protein